MSSISKKPKAFLNKRVLPRFTKHVLGITQQDNTSLYALAAQALFKIGIDFDNKNYKSFVISHESDINDYLIKNNISISKSRTIGVTYPKKYTKQIPQAINTALNKYSHPLLGKGEYNDFYKSTAWRQLRYLALKNASASCQCCGAGSTPGAPLHVDHIKPRSRYPELELNLDNLQVLCQDCNIGKGAWDDTDWRPK